MVVLYLSQYCALANFQIEYCDGDSYRWNIEGTNHSSMGRKDLMIQEILLSITGKGTTHLEETTEEDLEK